MYIHKPVLIVADASTPTSQIRGLRALALDYRFMPFTYHPPTILAGLPREVMGTKAAMLPAMERQEAHRVALAGGQLWVLLPPGVGEDALGEHAFSLEAPPPWLRISWDPWKHALRGLTRGRTRLGNWAEWEKSFSSLPGVWAATS